MQSRCKRFFRLNNYQVIKNIMTTTKETTTSKGPSSCESTFNEIKAYEVRALPTRLVAAAKLPVELLEDHNVSQALCRTAKASCFQRAHSVHVQLELCGSSFSPSVTPRLGIRGYPRWVQLQTSLMIRTVLPLVFLRSEAWLQRFLQAQQLWLLRTLPPRQKRRQKTNALRGRTFEASCFQRG